MAQLIRDVLLRDGSTLRLRAPTPEDYDDIKAFYDALAPQSRYFRFHGYGRTDAAARQYAEADGVDRVALIASQNDRIVAAAGYDVLREPGAAEVAFAVADDFRGRGTATRMLEQLAMIASERGVRRFDAEVLSENRPMLGVFRQAGFGLRRKGAFGELTVSLDITPSEAVLERMDERTHLAAVASLRPLVAPTSVAVVGAAPGNVGAAILARITQGGFSGVVTPVNDAGEPVHSVRAARSLADVPEAPELVVISTASKEVVAIAEQAAARKCKALLVLASDTLDDEEGIDRERLLDVVRTANMRLVGPHSLGLINTDPSISLNAVFAKPPTTAGGLAICSQSGAIGIGLLGHAAARSLGISTFASLGGRFDVSTNDLLEVWQEDARTAVVMLYLETFGNPEHFGRVAQRVSRRKPVLAVRGNRHPEARQPDAQSHTASALRGDAAVEALLRNAGVMRFSGGDDLFNAAEFFESQPLPHGRRVGIVSNSFGMATLARDACVTRGLLVGEVGTPVEGVAGPEPGPGDKAAVANPTTLPIGVSPAEYGDAVRALLADHGVDAVIGYYVDSFAGHPEEVLDAIAHAAAGQAKPVVASVVTADGQRPRGHARRRVPNFLFPESCAAVLARGAQRREWLSRPLGQRPQFGDFDAEGARRLACADLERRNGDRSHWMAIADAERLLAMYGLPVTPSRLCRDVEATVQAARELEGPVALKADFPPPAHASDIDAVLLGLEGDTAVTAGWREVQRRVRAAGWEWRGATVQPLEGPGADLLIGMVRDPDYGPVMALGLGGRQAGLGSDAAVRMLPGTDVEADELIDASAAVSTRLGPFRGQSELDRAALREVLLRFAMLLRDLKEVLEVDLNPTRCMEQGCRVLDVRIRVGEPAPSERVKTW